MDLRQLLGHWDRWQRRMALRKELMLISTSEQLAEQEADRAELRARLDDAMRCMHELTLEVAERRHARSQQTNWIPFMPAIEKYERELTRDMAAYLCHYIRRMMGWT